MREAILVLLTVLVAAPFATAGEEPDPAALAAQQAIDAWRAVPTDAESKEARLAALAELAKHDHPLVVEELGKRALRDREPEVRDVAAQVLGRMANHAERAGGFLRDQLAKNEKFPEVQISILRSIGRLRYLDARDEIEKVTRRYRDEDSRWVLVEAFRTLGAVNDALSLPLLLRFWEYKGKTKRGEAGEEVYSKQGEAKAREEYEAKHGKTGEPTGGADSVDKAWLEAVKASIRRITGQDFDDPLAFRQWYQDNRDRLEREFAERIRKAREEKAAREE